MFHLLNLIQSSPGTKVPHSKNTAELATVTMPIPQKIVLPMQQHVGAPCIPVVKKGDHVDVGTLVGDAPETLHSPIYSSVSGTVTGIDRVVHSVGRGITMVEITPDGQQTVDPAIQPPVVTDYASFIEAMHHSGIVGLGGAGFPTDPKIAPKNLADIDTLLINGAECEPYLSSDYREMLECTDTIISGTRACLKYLGIPKCKICIENNKPKAIDLIRKKLNGDPDISVCVLPSRYPQGAQNVLIKNATGRIVARGARHTSVNVLMLNITTVSTIGKFLATGMPLVSRRLTVTGDAVAHPQNVQVLLGTSMGDVLDFCGLKCEPRKVIMGGPMMGVSQMHLKFPIIKQNNGLLAFSEKTAAETTSTACIRCGRCINACPMGLQPVFIREAYFDMNVDRLDALMADLCIGCGTCSYVCPARRHITQVTTLAKGHLKSKRKRGKN